MHDDDHDNIFADDDALDYCIYEECEKEAQRGQENNDKGGCLGFLILSILPASCCFFPADHSLIASLIHVFIQAIQQN